MCALKADKERGGKCAVELKLPPVNQGDYGSRYLQGRGGRWYKSIRVWAAW